MGEGSEGIQFKAANADNGVQVDQIVALFNRAYGDAFPLREVYDSSFWRSRIGNSLRSFIAESNGEVVAHLAIRPDRDNPAHVQLCMPALDPRDSINRTQLAEGLWSCVERQAARQGWRVLYKFLLGSLPSIEHMIGSIFGFSEVALYTGYTLCRSTPCKAPKHSQRPAILVAQRIFADNMESREEALLYLPEHHQAICRYLYAPLGLGRKLAAGADRGGNGRSNNAVAADEQAVEMVYYRHSGACHLFVEPSLLRRFKNSLPDIDPCRFEDTYVFVNSFDSKTPSYCDYLEECGYRFCGVLPCLRGRDSIVYASRCSKMAAELPFVSPRAAVLASYIETNNFERATARLPMSADRIGSSSHSLLT